MQLIGIFTFSLMVRWSMLVGWWELIRDPRSIHFNKRYSGQKFVAARKRISGRSAKESEKKIRNFEAPETLEQPTFVLPDPDDEEVSHGKMSVPEPGDVSKRHETTNLFEVDDEDEEDVVGRKKGTRVKGDDESDLV